MQTALHIHSLVTELNKEISGGDLVTTEFYRKERAAYLTIKAKERLTLAFLYHPVHFGTFLVGASKIKLDTREKPYRIFDIENASVLTAEQYEFDRIFKLGIDQDGVKKVLVFEAMGPNGNIWLLDQNGGKLASLRKRDFQIGEVYQPSVRPSGVSPINLTVEHLLEESRNYPGVNLRTFLEKSIFGINTVLASEIVKRADVNCQTAGDLDESAVGELAKAVQQVMAAFKSPTAGYVYEIGGGFGAYPLKLSCCDSQPEKHKTLSLAVMAVSEMRQTASIEIDERKSTIDAVGRVVKRLEKRLVNIDNDIKEAAGYQQYKKMGELLKINFQKIRKGMENIEVEDVYADPPLAVTIALDPSQTPNENVELYFKKHRKGREGLDLLKRRAAITRDELAHLLTIKTDLEDNFETAQKRHSQDLLSLMPAEGIKQEKVERLPYKEYILSTGLKIFVGRDGSDNDRTTFEFARPYELWFHTQQCAGSHVVMKYPNKSFEPSRREIEETAAVAAFFSKARNDSLVPVIYTERRYVRKPRKAKPGLVTVEREKSVMVQPAKPD